MMLSCIRCNQILNNDEKLCPLCGGLGIVVSQKVRQAMVQPKRNIAPFRDCIYFRIGFCIFTVCFAIISLTHEIFLRQRLTEESRGIVTHNNSAYVAHRVNGELYIGRLRGSARAGFMGVRRGMPLRIYYNPANPRQIRTYKGIEEKFIAFGLFFFAIPCFLIIEIPKIKKEWEERA